MGRKCGVMSVGLRCGKGAVDNAKDMLAECHRCGRGEVWERSVGRKCGDACLWG